MSVWTSSRYSVGGAQNVVMPLREIVSRMRSASGLPMFMSTTVAPCCHWPKSFPQAALAQPMSDTVQWTSPSRRSCQ